MKLKRFLSRFSYLPSSVFFLLGIVAASLVELVFLHDAGKISLGTMLLLGLAFITCFTQVLILCETNHRIMGALQAKKLDNAYLRESACFNQQYMIDQDLELSRAQELLSYYKRRCRILKGDD